MTKKRVVEFSRYMPEPILDTLKTQFDVVSVKDASGEGKAAFREAIKGAHGLLGVGVYLDASLLEPARHLEIISSISVGYDSYDMDYLNKRGILLTNTPDVLTETTADLGFTLLMTTARRIVEMAAYIAQGHWTHRVGESVFGTDIHGKRLGVIGFGHIGQAIAKRGYGGFGMEVLYHSRRQLEEAKTFNARFCSLDELLSESDFVVVTVPLSVETTRLIGTRELGLMKPESILINIARGAVVDERALVRALQARQIRAAGLDVFEHEPISMDSPLLNMSNVVLTPHIGSATYETRWAMTELAIKNLVDGLNGKRPHSLVNGDVWERRLQARI